MLLVIDIGNTNIVFGVFKGETLVGSWRISTSLKKTEDEFALNIFNLLKFKELSKKDINKVIISSVVPPLINIFLKFIKKYINITPIIVEPGVKTGISIKCDAPSEVGADRIVNAVAGIEKYGVPLIIIDFGTATTFDFISSKKEYHGGVISPGINASLDSLFINASKLPKIGLKKPKTVIGKNTINSMQSGILYGYAGLIDGIIARMKREVKAEPKIVATGGLAKTIIPIVDTEILIDTNLTMDGLRIIHSLNC